MSGCDCNSSTSAPGLIRSVLALLARLFLGGVMAFAAYNKLNDPQAFAFSVKAFKILPDHLAILATFVVPWLEAICGAMLILGVWTRAAAFMSILQLGAFIAGIWSVLDRGLNVTCGCFGKYELFCTGPLGTCNMIQNASLAGVGVLILLTGPGRLSLCRRS